MHGTDRRAGSPLSHADIEARTPWRHSLRLIRWIVTTRSASATGMACCHRSTSNSSKKLNCKAPRKLGVIHPPQAGMGHDRPDPGGAVAYGHIRPRSGPPAGEGRGYARLAGTAGQGRGYAAILGNREPQRNMGLCARLWRDMLAHPGGCWFYFFKSLGHDLGDDIGPGRGC